MIVFPHCKINLGLRIHAKRPDGYHELSTLFYPIPLYDALEFVHATQPDWQTGGLPLESPVESNLVFKAYQLIKQDYPQLPFLRVFLYKAIPYGAGLGGGSSDAAFMLKALNEHFNLEIPLERLHQYATQLGSDCAYFLQDKPCMAFGRGERLEPSGVDLSGYHLLLLKPAHTISTAWAYSMIEPREPDVPLSDILAQPMHTWSSQLINDFEAPVFRHFPDMAELKNRLYQHGASYAGMSGSGSTLFGLFAPDQPLPVAPVSDMVQEFRLKL